jgi:hypothetical protein
MSVTALGQGVLLEGGMAYVFASWLDARWRGVCLANVLLVVFLLSRMFAPLIQAPWVISELTGQTMVAVLRRVGGEVALWAWAVFGAVAPENHLPGHLPVIGQS